MNIPILPRDFSTNMKVTIPFATAVAESEGGMSGRKSTRDVPLRQYTMTINPDQAEEVVKIILATRGARWPVAIRDYAFNFEMTNSPLSINANGKFPLTKTWTPATGGRSFSQRILLIDEEDTPFVIKSGGTPVSYTVTDPGLINVAGSPDAITASGQYLVPCVFMDDALDVTVHVKNLCSIESVNLREILEDELIALTTA